MRQRNRGSHLILMELMFVLFFFAVCGAVLLQVFVKSHNISVKAKELTETKNYVSQAAELFEAGYTDLKDYQQYFSKLKEKDGKYFELFSGVELKKESDIHSNGFAFRFKNTPYIENITPLVQYLRDKTLKTLSYENLFDFITSINVELILSSKKE